MQDDFEQQAWVKLGVAGALSRQYATDQRAFLEELARLLEQALPGEPDIRLRGGLFGKRSIQKVTVTFGENRYSLEDPGKGPLCATRTHVVRGIALKTAEVPVQEWLADLGAALDERAATSAAAREALARFVG